MIGMWKFIILFSLLTHVFEVFHDKHTKEKRKKLIRHISGVWLDPAAKNSINTDLLE